MSAFIEDNLLRKAGGIKYLGVKIENDELLTHTLSNVLVVLWLKTINPNLPMMIKQRFTTQLRTRTLFSIRDDISEAIASVLGEMQDREYTVNLAKGFNQKKNTYKSASKVTPTFSSQKKKCCCLCEAAGRPGFNSHFLSECNYLPQDDKKYLISKIRDINIESTDADSDDEYQPSCSSVVESAPTSCRVDVIASPVLEVFVSNTSADITLDSGSEVDLVDFDECKRHNLSIKPTNQKASTADCTPLQVVGEVKFYSVRGHHSLKFTGLAVKDLNCPILAGMPFKVRNAVYVRPREGTIYLGDCCVVKSKSKCTSNTVRNCKASILRAPRKVCLLPGDELTLSVPDEFKEKSLAVEPRVLTSSALDWLSCQTTNSSPNGEIKLKNLSAEPVLLKKYDQFAQIRHIGTTKDLPIQSISPPMKSQNYKVGTPFSTSIEVDPSNILTEAQREEFRRINLEYDRIFSPQIGCYNGASGPFSHVISMGPSLAPQRRGRIPIYSRNNLEMLQAKCDELLEQGVLAKPEDINVNVEYVNPSFLVKKSNGDHRLVTAFNKIGEFIRPQPAVVPKVEEVLHHIAQFKFLMKTDLSDAYYLIPLNNNSKKYTGIVTPYRGTLVYQRAVMDLPGSEASLECLLSRILGDLMIEGSVIKLAEDLYVGADKVEDLAVTWSKVLKLLDDNGLRLKPYKTVCCPTSTIIFRWLWEQGTIRPIPHRLNALLQCDPPENVTRLR
jgi:hypothetical protein